MNVFKLIKIFQGDICNYEGDAIVNAANKTLLGGGGVDGAIHFSAGPKLLEECRKLNGCETGQAKITLGYNLKSKYVIHTVGPIWHGGGMNEDNLLKECYKNSLLLAVKNSIRKIAFPCISTGAYGFPFERASKIALNTIYEFLNSESSIEEVSIYCFSDKDYKLFNDVFYDFKNNIAIPPTANIAPNIDTNPSFSL